MRRRRRRMFVRRSAKARAAAGGALQMAMTSWKLVGVVLALLCLLLYIQSGGAAKFDCPSVKEVESETVVAPWLDKYGAPSATVKVYFHGHQLKLGRLYGLNATQSKPHVTLKGSAIADQHFFTVIMVDPDAPSPTNPEVSDVLHWLVTNIPGSIKKSQEIYILGDEVVPYAGPAPPEGVHRYYVLLFSQGPHKISVKAPSSRLHFSPRDLINTYNLGPPLAGIFFRAEAGKFEI